MSEQHTVSSSDERSLQGSVALVTGATGGLGKAILTDLRERGATVYGVDIAGDGVTHADLSTAAGNRDMVNHVLAQAGRLDILVLNAGCQYVSPIDEFPDEEWIRLRSVMLDGPFFAIKAAWAALTRRMGGRIVITSSISGFRGARRKAAYVAAKHGVLGLMKVAALEGAASGLTANAVAPGWMDTPMMRGQLKAQAAVRGLGEDELVARFRSEQPGDRFVELREVAAAVGFLASPAGSGINGVCLPIDLGGSA
ncbi:SDR family NAD(P)-dependent oxidoreductase [Phyllobacterium endophyticum]|uniref:SDR family NAD(P)-dependent oxidoreductase n=1 Tax=Phyllobacterium endophyticum TaxID=1149773 RepID=UPI0011CC348E|nr:SDR family NAD(P)-dependent oxidoreductase [Phyllobacterium endophyticum]TXR50545.1 SDR family oxidoreductase [Phyllobacterium endophyticum]